LVSHPAGLHAGNAAKRSADRGKVPRAGTTPGRRGFVESKPPNRAPLCATNVIC